MRLHQIWTSALIALTVQSGAAFAEVTVSQSNEPQVVLGQQFRSLLGAEHKTIEALPEAERTALATGILGTKKARRSRTCPTAMTFWPACLPRPGTRSGSA